MPCASRRPQARGKADRPSHSSAQPTRPRSTRSRRSRPRSPADRHVRNLDARLVEHMDLRLCARLFRNKSRVIERARIRQHRLRRTRVRDCERNVLERPLLAPRSLLVFRKLHPRRIAVLPRTHPPLPIRRDDTRQPPDAELKNAVNQIGVRRHMPRGQQEHALLAVTHKPDQHAAAGDGTPVAEPHDRVGDGLFAARDRQLLSRTARQQQAPNKALNNVVLISRLLPQPARSRIPPVCIQGTARPSSLELRCGNDGAPRRNLHLPRKGRRARPARRRPA